jgi:hypothetical protein
LPSVADYFSVTVPDDTRIEVSPALDPHAASSCVPVWEEMAVAVDPAPRSDPENEPVTLAVPPWLGSANPTSPELLEVPPYPENVSTLGRIVEGVQAIWMVRAREVSRAVQEFVALEIVVDSVAPVTVGTFEPLVVHPAAAKAMTVDSALPPFVVSGGENVSEPVMLVQVTSPLASVSVVVGGAALGLGLELHAVAEVATTTSGTSRDNRSVRIMDMACSPWSFQPARKFAPV